MSEVEDFLAEVMPSYLRAVDDMHNGNPTAFGQLWSSSDKVSLLGGAGGPAVTGSEAVASTQRAVAAQFSNGTPVDFELIAADVNADLAYTVGYERSSMSVAGGPVQAGCLRATQIYRRENGQWKLVHRHADAAASPATEALRDALAARPTPSP